jgi:flagellar basal-body rod protein FlgG
VASSADTQVPTGIQVGTGVRPAAVQKMFTQGEFVHTQNELDMAIEGEGFFQVIQPNGETAYSRSGSFKLDNEGRVVTSDGFAMEPELTIPADSLAISVGIDGTVSVLLAGENQPTEIGNIELAQFVNPAGLRSIGRNLFMPSAASGDATTGTPGAEAFGNIAQGYLESSNVSVVDEMVNMIVAQRAYETNSKTIQASDEMLQTATNLRR